MSITLTPEQQAVLSNRGGSLLVSAAAGSGKTRVLVERLMNRVMEEGRNVDEFLIITYTRAAAAELRSRIADRLTQELARTPKDPHLRRQAALIYKAQISTVHSFCATLLQEFGHLVQLPPDVRLCDEDEAFLLRSQVLDDVLEARYEALDPKSDFAQLVDIMSAGRDDSRLEEIVQDIYSRIQSHPHPLGWLAEQERAMALEGVSDAGETVWGKVLLAHAGRLAKYWHGRMRRALKLTELDEKLAQAYSPSISVTLNALAAFEAATRQGWDKAAALAEIPFPRLGQVRGCEAPQAQESIKAIRDACKKRMGQNADLFQQSSADLLEDMATVLPAVRGLFALVRDFSAAYAAETRRRSLLDFSDLEHLSVALLVDDQGRPTEVAQRVSERYVEVMVDEFQDTNQVQNTIFKAISRKGRNLFMVGDVKQSIYRFRLADPTIFLHKYQTFLPASQAAEGQERFLTLSQNFRSRPQVLESVNFIFRNIMSLQLGEMDYTDEHALRPGGSFPEGTGYETELDVIDCPAPQDDQEARIDRNLAEARFAAQRIVQLLSQPLLISDGEGGVRPVQPGDIAILLRSPGRVLHHYIRALEEQGLPWEAEGDEDFFATTEVSVALSLLQVVDNPRQDVPLISVLRSPVYGFSADRLAQLRADYEGEFYDVLVQAARDGQEDCRAFLTQLNDLRLLAPDLRCHEFIWQIYQQTNLLGIFGAMPGGEQRREHLLALYELARRFEGTGHRGLFGFLTHLTRLREKEVKISASGSVGGQGIKILSIHRSKGLEFPVVLLCGLSRPFNREDMRKPILFHSKLGVGPKGLDRERMIEYPTLPRLAVARQLEDEMLAEEMRLLYVAMTRAKEKLILTHVLTRGAGELAAMREDISLPVDPQALRSCSCMGHWVLLAVLSRPEAAPLRQAAEIPEGVALPAEDGQRWDIRLTTAPEPELKRQTKEEVSLQAWQGEADPELVERLAWRYPYGRLADIPSKLTATQLKGRFLDEEAAQQAAYAPLSQKMGKAKLIRPRFAAEEFGLTAAEKGTALHLAIQHLRLEHTNSEEEIAQEVERMVALQLMTPAQAQAVDIGCLSRLFQSELGRQIRAAEKLNREFKFSLLVPASDYYPGCPSEEQVLLQGVVDCWFETGEGITLVDFKTDRVTKGTADSRAREYQPQMDAYTRALEEITGKPVTRRVLWFFALDLAVEV